MSPLCIVKHRGIPLDDRRGQVHDDGVSTVDYSTWLSSSPALVTIGEHGQLTWAADLDVELADSETRRSPHGDVIVLRQVWSRDRQTLRRLIVEASWAHGPMMIAEARRPRGGWHGDELARLMLAVLSLGTVVR